MFSWSFTVQLYYTPYAVRRLLKNNGGDRKNYYNDVKKPARSACGMNVLALK